MRAYIGLLFEFAGRPVLSLQERQSIVGTMQRAAFRLHPESIIGRLSAARMSQRID